jgi:sulfite oxidase
VLPPVHGFPLRVIAPGYVAARSVKWLAEIKLQAEPSSNYFQQQDYKLFSPDVTAENVDWTQGEMLGELNLNAVICSPSDGTSVQPGRVRITGYAVASGDHVLQGVEVSSDGGRTWTPATLDGEPQQWVWQLWHAELTLTRGPHTLVVRATDSSGTTQPPNLDTIWNFRGYMNNAWHRVTVSVTNP